MVKNAAFATSVWRRATCCKAEPRNKDIPIKIERFIKVLLSDWIIEN